MERIEEGANYGGHRSVAAPSASATAPSSASASTSPVTTRSANDLHNAGRFTIGPISVCHTLNDPSAKPTVLTAGVPSVYYVIYRLADYSLCALSLFVRISELNPLDYPSHPLTYVRTHLIRLLSHSVSPYFCIYVAGIIPDTWADRR